MPQIEPINTNPLTLKQKTFVNKYVENGGNATQAALQAYDADRNNSKVIGSHNLDKPAIIRAIDEKLKEVGMNTDSWIADKLKYAVENGINNKLTAKDALNALSMVLKVNGSYPTAKKMSMKISLTGKLTDKKVNEAIETVKKLSVKSNDLVKDLTS